MIIQLLLFLSLLAILFILSRKISSYLYFLLFLLTNSKNISISILSLILLPGTIVHELSHFLLASILRVPTGELSVIPTIDEKTGEVKAGKLEIGKVDPFRHTLVGLAPLVVGILLIYVVGKIFFSSYIQPISFIGIYLSFIVSATMFSSNKDMESLKIALPITCLIILSLYFIGLRISLTANLIVRIGSILKELNGYLLIATAVNFVVLVFLAANLKLWSRFFGAKIEDPRFTK